MAQADLEDAVQEVFVVVHKRLDEYEERAALRGWLYAICLRVGSRQRRTSRRRREQAVSEIPEVSVDADQEQGIELRESLRLGQRLLEALPEKHRMVFMLYEVDHMSMAEIAEIVGCPIQTAYSRLHKARERVRVEFGAGASVGELVMRDPHEPVCWNAGESDAPDELRRALAALADSERPQAEELQRVRVRLLAAFEAPAPATRRLRLVHALSGSMDVLVLGLAIVGGLVAWLRLERSGQESMPPSAAGRAAEELASPRALGEAEAAAERWALGEREIAALKAGLSGAVPHALESDDGADARRLATRAPALGARAASVRSRDSSMIRVHHPGNANSGDAARAAVGRGRPSSLKPGSDERSATLDENSSAPQSAASQAAAAATAPARGSDNSTERTSAASAAPEVGAGPVAASGDSAAVRASAASVGPRFIESGTREPVAIREPASYEQHEPAADGGHAVLLDEATLLQRARRLSSSDPAQALRVLDEHKRRFPAGMLRPEREVLAIELLRSLSRTREAERRARDFRRDYPKSIYLWRIQL